MILNERKIKILEAIINDYIQTAEPIGSRTIAKKYNLGVSSATIRNEMSDLEELGLIIQPHASAGRVPSDKGYRLYVDRLMRSRKLSKEEIVFLEETVKKNITHIDYMMRQTAKALAMLTNYTTVISEPKAKKVKIKHVQLIPFDETAIITVIVTDNKIVKNHIIKVSDAPDNDVLNKLSAFINNMISDYSIEQIISSDDYKNLDKKAYGKIVKDVLSALYETVKTEEDIQFYTSGVNNILDFPEFSDIGTAKSIFKALEERDILINIISGGDKEQNDRNVKIMIGNENDMEQLKNCSIIKTDYKFGSNSYGSIGIIGPTRMDYAQVVSVLNCIVKYINDVIKVFSDG